MNDRSKQLEKALSMLDKQDDLVQVIVPAHVNMFTGNWELAQFVDIYRDQLDIYRQIYGKELIVV